MLIELERTARPLWARVGHDSRLEHGPERNVVTRQKHSIAVPAWWSRSAG